MENSVWQQMVTYCINISMNLTPTALQTLSDYAMCILCIAANTNILLYAVVQQITVDPLPGSSGTAPTVQWPGLTAAMMERSVDNWSSPQLFQARSQRYQSTTNDLIFFIFDRKKAVRQIL